MKALDANEAVPARSSGKSLLSWCDMGFCATLLILADGTRRAREQGVSQDTVAGQISGHLRQRQMGVGTASPRAVVQKGEDH